MSAEVLILIILEVTLWALLTMHEQGTNSLNPYYTGSYSMSFIMGTKNASDAGLNPYYTGSYSMSPYLWLGQYC